MNKKIICTNVEKKYNDQKIFDDFSYEFKDTGLYVLFGPSGSGKTTLLNILYGNTSYTNGKIIINNIVYDNQVDNKKMFDEIVYLAQDGYFIDYLSVMDNLKLCSENTNRVNELLKKFKLSNIKDSFPNDLSGGEKKRLSLIIAILKDKKILLLDEPTSSLDIESKKIIIEFLKEIKSKVLIICSTHDESIKSVADQIIDFKNLKKYEKQKLNIMINDVSSNIAKPSDRILSKTNLYSFVKKEKYYNLKDSKSRKIFIGIIFLTLLIAFLCYSPKHKLMDMIEHDYKINHLLFYCPIDSKDNCSFQLKNKKVSEVVYQYNKNIGSPYDKNYYTNGMELQAITLPFKESSLNLKNIIQHGTYFSKKGQIILGSDYALKYSDDPKKMIGKELEITLLDGKDTFEIVGIFKKMTNIEKRYFESILEYDIDNMIFLNGEYTKKYITLDNSIYQLEKNYNKNTFVAYFESFDDMYSFYQYYEKNDNRQESLMSVQKFNESFVTLYMTFQSMTIVLYPLVLIALLFSVLFYFSTKGAELNNRKHIFSVYNYYGYSYETVRTAYIKFYLFETLKLFGYSLLIAVLFSAFVNYVNYQYNFLFFKIFTINMPSIIIIMISIMVSSLILIFNIFKKIGSVGWYQNLNENRDLI